MVTLPLYVLLTHMTLLALSHQFKARRRILLIKYQCVISFLPRVLKATLPKKSCTKLDQTLQMLAKQHPQEVISAYYLKKDVS